MYLAVSYRPDFTGDTIECEGPSAQFGAEGRHGRISPTRSFSSHRAPCRPTDLMRLKLASGACEQPVQEAVDTSTPGTRLFHLRL